MLSIIGFFLSFNNANAANYFTLPVDVSSITSGYSDLRAYDEDGIENDIHGGIDYDTADTGTFIYAAAPGVTELNSVNSAYGNHVIIFHDIDDDGDTDYTTLYAHLSVISVSDGASVSRGQKIGEGGSTGYVTGSHLHFEVRTGNIGGTFDPYDIYEDLGSEYPDYSTSVSCGSNYVWSECPPVNAEVFDSPTYASLISTARTTDLHTLNKYNARKDAETSVLVYPAILVTSNPSNIHWWNYTQDANDFTPSSDSHWRDWGRYTTLVTQDYSGDCQGAVVYDVFGGATRAYVVQCQQWDAWLQTNGPADSKPTVRRAMATMTRSTAVITSPTSTASVFAVL